MPLIKSHMIEGDVLRNLIPYKICISYMSGCYIYAMSYNYVYHASFTLNIIYPRNFRFSDINTNIDNVKITLNHVQ